MPLVTTDGFRPASPPPELAFDGTQGLQQVNELDLQPDADVADYLDRLPDTRLIRIAFPSYADGRGFSLARRLRNVGYKGHLRAAGYVISDQFRYALACGFDDVEITEALAARQPEADWLDNQAPLTGYRDRLKGQLSTSPTELGKTHELYTSQNGIFEQQVTAVEHFSGELFSFRVTRPASFRFRSGEFAMIGLPNAAQPVFRAYSLASPSWGDELEFYSIKVPGGPLTQHLQNIQVGDTVLLKNKATGTLVLDALSPGSRLFLISTGTGIAPFASLIRDPESYEKFDEIFLIQTCRTMAELRYGNNLISNIENDPIVGDEVKGGRLKFTTSLTRQPHALEGRATDLISNGQLFSFLSIHPIDPNVDRAMVCGSVEMLKDMRDILESMGLEEGSNSRPNSYVVERAFAG